MKKNTKIILGALGTYLVLLLLLVLSEARAAGASITSFTDAVWFSLITMTTVGYGDMSPVSPLGRVVGVLFALFSLGVFSALISIGLGLINGRLRPMLRLKRGRKKPWFVFNEENAAAAVLAGKLAKENPGCLLVFPPADGEDAAEGNTARYPADAEKLVKLRGTGEGVSVFLMKQDEAQNRLEALGYAGAGMAVFCMTDGAAEGLPAEVRLFSRAECLGRSYWNRRPLGKGEKSVVLVGCGRCGAKLLEHGLLNNVFEPGRAAAYHVFGDSAGFALTHPRLTAALSGGADGDTLTFYADDWRAYPELLSGADRIILCGDDDGENLAAFDTLKTWFPAKGRVDVRLDTALSGMNVFGTADEVITPESVMKDALNRRAMLINDLYNEDSGSPTEWKALSYFHKQANIAAADHLLVKVRFLLGDDSVTALTEEVRQRAFEAYRAGLPGIRELTEEIEHRRWMRFHLMYNWTGGEPRNNAMRVHPCLKPFAELPLEEQRKDDYAWEILGRLKAEA